jgi:hypothetical protein
MEHADINDNGGAVTIDNTGMVDDAYTYDLLGTLVLKTPLSGNHVSSASIDNDASIVGYYEDDYGYGYLVIGHQTNTMGRLSQDTYTLEYTLGDAYMPAYVDMTGVTYNVHSCGIGADSAVLAINMYGTQDVKVSLPFTPAYVQSDNPDLVINDWSYASPFITMEVHGTDMQGELGSITILETDPTAIEKKKPANPAGMIADGSSLSFVVNGAPVSIQYDLKSGKRLAVHIFDLRSQRIHTLWDRHASGRGSINWDGRLASGQSPAPGVYTVSARIGDQILNRKITLIK